MGESEREPGGQPSVPLQMIVTTWAAYYFDSLLINPCSWVKVYGPAGHTINCTVLPGVEMIGLANPDDTTPLPSILYPGNGQSYGSDSTYPAILNDDGYTWFLVRGKFSATTKAASELFFTSVQAEDANGDGNSVSKQPSFQLYSDGNPSCDPTVHFEGYNYTTGAPADGLTPCCIYVQADPGKSGGYVRVQITDKNSSAQIVGAPETRQPQWLDVPLESDGTAAILIVDPKDEAVPFTIGLPYAQGTNHLGPFTMYFHSFPYLPGSQ